jgi:hypothetical protein
MDRQVSDIFGGIQVIITIFPFDNRGIGQAIISTGF